MSDKRSIVNEVPRRLRAFAKEQRSAMPRAEALFWEQVRAGRLHGHKFKRQVPIAPYIVDFLCVAAKVVVELDGPLHDAAECRVRDADRDAWLRRHGFLVLRFPNDQVLGNCQAVLDAVLAAIETRLAPLSRPLLTQGPPSPAEGGRVLRETASSNT